MKLRLVQSSFPHRCKFLASRKQKTTQLDDTLILIYFSPHPPFLKEKLFELLIQKKKELMVTI